MIEKGGLKPIEVCDKMECKKYNSCQALKRLDRIKSGVGNKTSEGIRGIYERMYCNENSVACPFSGMKKKEQCELSQHLENSAKIIKRAMWVAATTIRKFD